MKKEKKTAIIGGSLILLALIFILSIIFVPKIVYKRQMRQLFAAMTADTVTHMAVGDPLYPTLDLLGNKGKSVTLTAEQMREVQAFLSSLDESGYRVSSEERSKKGQMDLNLRVRNEMGENLNLYFLENAFYFTKEDQIISFKPKSEETYHALYDALYSYLAQ